MSLHCIVWYCIVGFGARAVSRKTPTYFIVTTGLKLQVVTIEVGNTRQNSLSVLLRRLVHMIVIGMGLNKMFDLGVG